jgi:hypothetical protein
MQDEYSSQPLLQQEALQRPYLAHKLLSISPNRRVLLPGISVI